MSRQSEIAYAHQHDVIRLGTILGRRVTRLWRRVNVADLEAGWDVVAPQMAAQVAAAQLAAAQMSAPYLASVDQANQFDAAPAAVVPEAFSNVMGDGREVAPALYGAVTNTKTLIGRGMPPAQAFEIGANFLALVASAAVHDSSRNSDRVLAAGKTYTTYIRVVSAGACSRCAILAGAYSAARAFQRHVHCECTTCPIVHQGFVPDGFHASPLDYFDSLSREEQDRVFTNAGAEAIRQGADPSKVVTARRGAYGIGYSGHTNVPVPSDVRNRLRPVTIGRRADGSPLQVYATTEGTTVRGSFGRSEIDRTAQATKEGRYRRTTTLRLMPEQIAVMAGHDPKRWTELLERYGYLYPTR